MSSGNNHAFAPSDRLRDFSTSARLLLLSAMALVVGSFGAGAAWLLQRLIYLVTNIAYFGRLSADPVLISDHPLGWVSVLIPMAGCLIIGLMARFGSEKIRGHGIPEAIEAILIGKSRIQPKVAFLKPLSSAISIGSGGPFGAEGPIIMTGGALGSIFAQMFHLSSAERKTLLVAGAAAGMSATFNSPVAAILLAVELLLFEWKPRSFIPVSIASAVAAAWRPFILGGGILFPMHASPIDFLPLTLLVCAVLGVASGLFSGLLTQMVYKCEDFFGALPIHWMWWPVFGGFIVGVGGLVDPHALGVGYDNIAALLDGSLTGWAAFRLLAVKAVIWSVALGSGTSGGVLAPLLMMGGVIGSLSSAVIPFGDSGFWALITMAAIMGGTMRAPLTAMIFAFELTHNADALLPLAVACVVAQGTTVLLLKRSILTEKVARHGHHIFREYIVDPFETIRARDVMIAPVDTLSASMMLADAVAFFTAPEALHRHKAYPVVADGNKLAGMVSRGDALRWVVGGYPADTSLGQQVAGTELVSGYADEPAGIVADRMIARRVECIPILHRHDDTLAGILTRSDLLRVRGALSHQEGEREIMLPFKMAVSPLKLNKLKLKKRDRRVGPLGKPDAAS
jgi:H+/Cl- antiporter ClcA/CBS domain-containing protein